MASPRRVQRIRRETDGTLILTGPTARQIARWGAHISSAYATCLLVQVFVGEGLNTLLIGILVELILYKGKALLWEGRRQDAWGLACLVLDTITNAGGLYPSMMRLNDAQVWKMFAEAFTLGDDMRSLPALILALVAGFLLAVAPFALKDDDK